jgi:hypothetical protein
LFNGANVLQAAIGDVAGNVGYASATVTVQLVTNAVYAYHPSGCLTNVFYEGNGFSGGAALAWNSRYELMNVKIAGTLAESYQYDALGRRVTISDGSTTNWLVYDGIHVIAETTAGGAVTKSYVYGPGVDTSACP